MSRVPPVLAAALLVSLAASAACADGLPPAPVWLTPPGGAPPAPTSPQARPTSPPPPQAQARPAPARPAVSEPRSRTGADEKQGVTAAPRRTMLHGNTLALTNRGQKPQTQYPFQFGRPFLPGEILHRPEVLVDGRPVPTQADIKQRHPDGSVRFAILSLILPSLAPEQTVTLTFRDQEGAPPGPTPDVAAMLGPDFDFDATIEASSPTFAPGRTVRVSARELLTRAGHCADDVVVTPTALCAYWTRGPIATTVILADHSAKPANDFGFLTDRRPVRPLFHVTFWPGLHRVRVRVIGEISNSEAMQDEIYDLTLRAGREGKSVYTRPGFVHHFASRWSRVFWLGPEPEPAIDIDFGAEHLIRTRLVPHYDTAQPIDAPFRRILDTWSRRDHQNIGDPGLWEVAMPTVGGRPDIGPLPTWTVLWLLSADWRIREIALTQADLAANWPLQVREGNPAKTFDPAHRIPGLGRTVTVYGRPSLWLFDPRGQNVVSRGDDIPVHTPTGMQLVDPTTGQPAPYFQRGNPGLAKDRRFVWGDPRFSPFHLGYFDRWKADGAHQPDPFFLPYLLTGDYWYLEEMQLWAGATSLRYCAENAIWCRGPGAGIHDEIRGHAWVLRNRVNAAVASPDAAPEKMVLTAMVDDALAGWEGVQGITGTAFENTPLWRFYRDGQVKQNIPPSPLHFWRSEKLMEELVRDATEPGTLAVGGGTSPWMQNYFIIELGRAAELGFRARPLLDWLGENLIGQLTDPGFNPYLCQAYRMPVTKADQNNFRTWSEVLQGYPVGAPDKPRTQQGQVLTGDLTYVSIARAAASFLTDTPRGQAAWTRIQQITAPRAGEIDVSWAITPRN